MSITFNPIKFKQLYCVYTHGITDGTTLYMGVCKLHEVIYSPDARRNKMWRDTVGKMDEIVLNIVMITEHITEAYNHRYKVTREVKYYCNAHGVEINRRSQIKCNETGVVYDNAATACQMLGIAPSAMSNHLNGRVGYKSIHNFTFERI